MSKNAFALIIAAGAMLAGSFPVSAQPLDEAGEKAAVSELSGKDLSKKIEAAGRLGASRRASARKALSDSLKKEKDRSARRAMIEAMASDPEAAGDAAVVSAAKADSDPEARMSAVWALGFAKTAASRDALIAIMLDEGEKDAVRVRAASSLSNSQSRAVLNAYLSALNSASAEVRRTALMMAVSVYGYEKETLRPHLNRFASGPDPAAASYAAGVLADWAKRESGRK